jgi:hypothetical protein
LIRGSRLLATQAVPALLSVAGLLQTIGSTHFPRRSTNPDRHTHSVPAAFGISGRRHSIGCTHSLPRWTVPGGQMH